MKPRTSRRLATLTLWLAASVAASDEAAARTAPPPFCDNLGYLGWQVAIGNPGLDQHTWALEGVDDSSSLGPALYACGDFATAGGVTASHVAKWDGSAWSPLVGAMGEGLSGACEDIRLGPDDRLYMTGEFSQAGGHVVNYVTAWDGTDFQSINSGLDNLGLAIEFFDSKLWLGGYFMNPSGVATDEMSHITAWDGTFWDLYGTPGAWGTDSPVWELREWDDGTGSTIYVAGGFSTITGNAANRIAKLSGATFVPLGSGLINNVGSQPVQTLIAFDDGSGEKLVAGGNIDSAGGVPVSNLAAWDGSAWSDVGGGVDHALEGLAVADVGDGRKLYAFGYHTMAGTGPSAIPVSAVSSWSGSSWSSMLGGTTPIGILEHGMFGEEWQGCLYVTGGFDYAGALATENIARWCCNLGAPAVGNPWHFQIRRFLPLRDLEITDDDGDGLPEKVRCNDVDYEPVAGSSIDACGLVVRLGTPASDVIDLSSLTGEFLVFAGDGSDQIIGSSQVDVIFGGGGADAINGGNGDDELSGDTGEDELAGSAGDDRVSGGEGDDVVRGGDGDDALTGAEDVDLVDGGSGDDLVHLAESVTQDIAQIRCLTKLSRAGSKLARLRTRQLQSCTRNEAAVAVCSEIEDDRIAKGRASVDSIEASLCSIVPDVSYTTASNVADINLDQARGLLTDLFGSDPDAATLNAQAIDQGPACQGAILRQAGKLMLVQLRAFDTCQASQLKAGPIATGSPFESCYAAMSPGSPTPAPSSERLLDSVQSDCPQGTLAELLPGPCTASPDIGDCLVARVTCRACRTISLRGGNDFDCDTLDNGLNDSSCGP